MRIGKQARQVDGRWRGLTKLGWGFRLPGGRFGEGPYAAICNESQRLFLRITEGHLQAGLTLKSASSFQRYFLRFIEHVLLVDPEVSKIGVNGISIDHIHSFLSTHRQAGTFGTARIQERIETFIHREIAGPDLVPAQRWFDAQDADLQARIDCLDRKIASLEPSATPTMLCTLDPLTLRAARRLFAWKRWFDKDGMLQWSKVAEAIECDAKRATTKAVPYYLRQFELANDYREQEFSRLSYRLERSPGKTMGERYHSGLEYSTTSLCDAILTVSGAAAGMDVFALCDIANVSDVRAAVAPYRHIPKGRTRTIPASLGIEIISHCVAWYLDYSTPIASYVGDVAAAARRHQKRLPKTKGLDAVEHAVAETPLPDALSSLRIVGFKQRDRNELANLYRGLKLSSEGSLNEKRLSFVELVRLNVAVCLILSTVLGAPRRNELLELPIEKVLIHRRRAFIEVELRKTGLSDVRVPFKKPVPRLLVDFIRSIDAVKRSLLKIFPSRDRLVSASAFYTFGPLGLKIIHTSVSGRMLELFSEHFQLKDKDGRAWYLAFHQLRRCFALSFFHCGGRENSLPALSWFLGHDDIATTWRYIREELTGAEISSAEAVMATSALYSDDTMESTARLRSLVLEHFGVSRITLIDEQRVQDYLEILQEKGVYRVEPVEIRTSNGVRYSVMIVVKAQACLD